MEDIPLGTGTNHLLLTATDAWGNTTTSNMTVVQSGMQVSGFSLGSTDDLFQATASVSGWASDGVMALLVNEARAQAPAKSCNCPSNGD